jgi:hypothetical protein
VTTSVISNGQVIHKIQRDLQRAIATLDEKLRVERLLQKQHADIIRVIKSDDFALDIISRDGPRPAESVSLSNRLNRINGVVNVFKIDNNGNFDSENVSKKFKKFFKSVFRNIQSIMEIFDELPGGHRETGVVEVERRRLYLVSGGKECYFVLADGLMPASKIEKSIRDVLYSTQPH